jgi:gliding motility-associated-like protein
MKRHLLLLSIVFFKTVYLIYGQNNFGVCCPYSGWDYVVPITITNNGAAATAANLQTVFILNTQTPISQGKMNASGNDIRFTDGTCGNYLSYYIESGINTANTNIWIRLPSIPAGGSLTIYMYYGNPGAAAAAVTFNTMFPSVLTINAPTNLSGVQTYDWIDIQAGGTITMPANGTPPAFQARKIIFNGTFNGNNLGYGPQSGPGAGRNGGGSCGGSGGGYGGVGGIGGGCTPGGVAYGTPAGADIDKGSGGGGSDCAPSAAGGGAISFIGSVLVINGTINVNGQTAQNCCCGNSSEAAGGGAGGGVLMQADYISGTASVNARGGNGGNSDDKEGGGGGAGGRVKIRWADNDGFTGTVAVNGGANGVGGQSGQQPGAAGTFQRPQIQGLARNIGAEVPVSIPTADFTFNNVCLNSQATFTDISTVQSGGSITQWDWTFGDGGTANTQNPTHTYSAPNSFNVSLTVTSVTGCTHNIIKQITVSALPVADFTAPSVCENNPTQFSDASTGGVTQWNWAFGDGGTDNTQNPVYTYSAAGTYNVTLTVSTPSNCSHTVNKSVTVDAAPVANFNFSDVCLNAPSNFTDASTSNVGAINQWSWNFGDGNNSNQQNPSHTYTSEGTYDITLTVTSANGCPNSITKQTTIFPLPVASFNIPAVCLNVSSDFTDASVVNSGTITAWNWNFGDGSTSVQQNPSHTYLNPGTYNVTLTVTTNNNCSASGIQPATVHELPVADFSVSNICLGFPAQFTDISTTGSGSTVSNWQWDFGNAGATSNIQNPVYTYTISGNYVIMLTVTDNNGCIDDNSKSVSVFENTTACYGEADGSATAIPSGGNGTYSYLWSDGTQTALNNNLFAGDYFVTVTDGNGCTVSGTASVTETSAAVIPFAVPDSQRIIFGDTVTVVISSNFDPNVVYSISPDYNLSCTTCDTLLAYPNKTTVYTISATDTSTGCKGSGEFIIRVDEKYILYVPNVFTPNNDGINDDIRVYAKGLKFFHWYIFDRWGEQVFYSDDISTPWDGTLNGKQLNPDIYVYHVKLGYLTGVIKEEKGSITILK